MRGKVRPSRLTILLLGVAWLGIFGPATAAEEVSKAPNGPAAFDIPAQPLRDALYRFASQAGLQVSFNTSDIDRSLYSRPLKGSYTPEKGLKRLLKGTQLEFDFVDRGTVIVRERPQSVLARKAPSEPEQKPAPMEEVIVTGTSIRGIAPVGSPVLVFTPDDFDSAGSATVQQFLSTLTQTFGGVRSDDTSAGSRVPGIGSDRTFGGSSVDLRGLGTGSTLVLINGRRQALSGAAEYVDISLIPLSAVERIEVLLDGASAIYGSDAVGGVVNFILLSQYDGLRTRLYTGTTTQGGGTEYQFGQTVGHDWASGNVLLNYEFYKQQPIKDDQRAFTEGILGNNDFISGQTKHSVLLSAGQAIVEDLRVSLDALYSQRVGEQSYFVPSQGAEDSEAKNSQASAAISVMWQPSPAWSGRWDVGSSVNRIDTETEDAFTAANTLFKSRYTLRHSELLVNGRLFSLPAGPIKLATGGGYREENYWVSVGSVDSPASRRIGDDSVTSVFAELMIPLLRGGEGDPERPRLAISLAERYEDYDSFGHRFNPKFGLEWAATTHLKLRGSYGKSFRAPGMQQRDPTTGFYFLQNVSTPAGVQRIISKSGNSSTLGPETSTSWTAGLDFHWGESQDFNAKLTGFNIDYRNRIAAVPVTSLQALTDSTLAPIRDLRAELGDAAFDALAARALSGQDYRVVSGCPVAFRAGFACNEPAANFAALVDRGLGNLSTTRELGLDVSIEGAFRTSRDVFKLGLSTTSLFDYRRRLTVLSPEIDLADTVFNPLDFRMVFEAGWLRGGWETTLRLNHSDRYRNPRVDPVAKVASWTTLDLSLRYDAGPGARLFSNTALVFNLRNLFDADPPFIVDVPQTGIAYDPANADPYGRQLSLMMTKNW